MIYTEPLGPTSVTARARKQGKLSFAFGPRFFVALLLGFVALGPAWWFRQAIAVMFLWDGVVIAAWLWDLLRLPRPAQLEVRRTWEKRPCLGVAASVAVEIQNDATISIRARVVDETPAQFRSSPPDLAVIVKARSSAEASYPVMPAERGDTKLGRIFLRYQSALGLAERWAVAETQQTIRVLPNLEQAKRESMYLIRSRQAELEKRRRRQRGMGREFDSLREYREGDELRDISWTATARRRHLITRVFQMERSQNVWLVLDAGRLLRAQVRGPGDCSAILQTGLCRERRAISGAGRSLLRRSRGFASVWAQGSAEFVRRPWRSSRASDCRIPCASSRGSLRIGSWARRTSFAERTEAAKPGSLDHGFCRNGDHSRSDRIRDAIDAAASGCLCRDGPAGPEDSRGTIPAVTEDLYRHGAALEISQRRDILMRGLRQRGVLALELMPGMLASSLVTQYLNIKERSLI